MAISPSRRCSWVWARRVALLALIIVGTSLAIITALFHMDALTTSFRALQTRAREWASRSPALVALCGVLLVSVWIVCCVPSSPIEMLLGYVYELLPGFILVYLGKVLGCGASYYIGRRARERHGCCGCGGSRLLRSEIVEAVAIVAREHPYRCSLLIRAAYIPIAFKVCE